MAWMVFQCRDKNMSVAGDGGKANNRPSRPVHLPLQGRSNFILACEALLASARVYRAEEACVAYHRQAVRLSPHGNSSSFAKRNSDNATSSEANSCISKCPGQSRCQCTPREPPPSTSLARPSIASRLGLPTRMPAMQCYHSIPRPNHAIPAMADRMAP